jgi:transposase-like protein
LDYLDWLRWRDGFVCPHCQSVISWVLRDGRHACGDCVSPTGELAEIRELRAKVRLEEDLDIATRASLLFAGALDRRKH